MLRWHDRVVCAVRGHRWPAQIYAYPSNPECVRCKLVEQCHLCLTGTKGSPPSLPFLKGEMCERCGTWRKRTIAQPTTRTHRQRGM